ncbi:hypothetical protein LSTR_LSTR007205 [Laodelphax striatellus]|uniref:IMD domain-containing protein n=1 Tax=Laodelphax striatellus TaxID=195883 RepID=A0A482XEJ0_LAOST|nr:hypothetical protein LSTR_LSTR007205 [Laodelphax striatellus]
MEGSVERECSALGGLFQQIITDLKNGTPLWEDFVAKATKLHTCLRATINAIAVYLDAFQKIADAATNTRGATKEIGTALTRICLRHKAVEARMKTFSSAIMDCLVVPLQEKLEEWKKAVINLDKEHTKDYKRARAELKKRSTDTLRLQKKAKKSGAGGGSVVVGGGGELQRRVESSLHDITERRHLLEETEKRAVRAALIEQRSRFCIFVAFMKPVVDEEVAMLSELSHLQEVVEQLEKHTADPYTLPPASEQVISDLKGSDNNSWTFHTPPSSPSSLGSRKSSMCSISSLNSSSSGSTKSHHSPSHHYWHRSLSQRAVASGTMRLSSVSSQDSGFTSQDMLFHRPQCNVQVSSVSDHHNGGGGGGGGGSVMTATGFVSSVSSSSSQSTLPTNPTATWPNLQETLQFERAATAIMNERPHTISSEDNSCAYERGHQRPPLTVYTFHAPDAAAAAAASQSQPASPATAQQQQPIYARPPIPQRCSSLERPSLPLPSKANSLSIHLPPPPAHSSSANIKHIAPEVSESPMYVNMHELANLAATKAQEMVFPLPPPPVEANNEKTQSDNQESTSESSLESSSGYGSQTIMAPNPDDMHNEEFVMNANNSSGHYTLPRASISEVRFRPSSASGYAGGTMRGTLLRRSSIQGQKPPPPIRRTSSISINAKQLQSGGGSMENLPPPPPFLLEGGGGSASQEVHRSISSSIAAEIQKRNASSSVSEYQRTAALGIAAELQRKVAMSGGDVLKKPSSTESIYGNKKTLGLEQQQQQPTNCSAGSNSISVAETVRTLTELKHQPASPVSVRRTHSLRSQSCERRVETGLIAALSAKLASPRRCSNEAAAQQQQSRSAAAMQGVMRASRVRQWIAVRTVADPATCHDSLMDQIKKGTALKKTRAINDRSAPQIH